MKLFNKYELMGYGFEYPDFDEHVYITETHRKMLRFMIENNVILCHSKRITAELKPFQRDISFVALVCSEKDHRCTYILKPINK